MNRMMFSIVVTTMLAACSSKPADPVVATPATRQPTVIDPQLKALDDAKKVQATLDEADRKRRKAIEDAGG
ncbi:MAG: hypothetical protein ABIR16_01040 [Dokdonella sp.]